MPDSPFVFAPRTLAARLAGLGLACLLVVALDLWLRTGPAPPARARWVVSPDSVPAGQLRKLGQGQIPMPANTPSAHASALLAMPAGHPTVLFAFWFAGSSEGAADVQVVVSGFDRATQSWSPAYFVLNRQSLGEQLGFAVRRLGNPVAWLDDQERIHLFVVATGPGGWAAARVVHLRQVSETRGGEPLAFAMPRVLPLSWLWNLSFLVRNAPLALHDGGMVLPVHFELGIKYPAALRFNARGEFLGMRRISDRHGLLQPTLLMQSETHWLALMRDQRPAGHVAVAQTVNGGLNWTDLPDTALPNPDAAVAALALAPGRMLLAHNSSPDSRVALDLSSSTQGRDWVLARPLVHGGVGEEYSYPALAWAQDSLWLSYTDRRRRIAWQRYAFCAAGC